MRERGCGLSLFGFRSNVIIRVVRFGGFEFIGSVWGGGRVLFCFQVAQEDRVGDYFCLGSYYSENGGRGFGWNEYFFF